MSRDEATSRAESNWSIRQEYILENNDVEIWGEKMADVCEREFSNNNGNLCVLPVNQICTFPDIACSQTARSDIYFPGYYNVILV
jgi:hypothetical protein